MKWKQKITQSPFFTFDRELKLIICCLNYCWHKKRIWSITNERFNALFWCDRSKLTNLSIFYCISTSLFCCCCYHFSKVCFIFYNCLRAKLRISDHFVPFLRSKKVPNFKKLFIFHSTSHKKQYALDMTKSGRWVIWNCVPP